MKAVLAIWVCGTGAWAFGMEDGHGSDERIKIELVREEGNAIVFTVRGLSEAQLREAAGSKTPNEWSRTLAVYVGEGETERPPLLGEYVLSEDVLRFEPRFPLEPGLAYTAIVRGSFADDSGSVELTRRPFEIPAAPPQPPTFVTQIFPSRDVLPENQLKFYLHFSAPMSGGDSYRYIRLREAGGDEIELPFLELGEELWNDSMTRLTVFFDPGRIKRGLKPREDVGPVLEEGKSYMLLIDSRWPDARGEPLKEGVRKEFRVGKPDERQPDPERWKLDPPRAGSRAALTVRFDEPLDHAMLHRVLTVRTAGGEAVAGRIEVDKHEMRWRFRPDEPWGDGAYELAVETTLEDLAGNSIGRSFEVDVFETIGRSVSSDVVSLPFQTKPPCDEARGEPPISR